MYIIAWRTHPVQKKREPSANVTRIIKRLSEKGCVRDICFLNIITILHKWVECWKEYVESRFGDNRHNTLLRWSRDASIDKKEARSNWN